MTLVNAVHTRCQRLASVRQSQSVQRALRPVPHAHTCRQAVHPPRPSHAQSRFSCAPVVKGDPQEFARQQHAWLLGQKMAWYEQRRVAWEAERKPEPWAEWLAQQEAEWTVSELPTRELQWLKQWAAAAVARETNGSPTNTTENTSTTDCDSQSSV